jgi:hypothetical protein
MGNLSSDELLGDYQGASEELMDNLSIREELLGDPFNLAVRHNTWTSITLRWLP